MQKCFIEKKDSKIGEIVNMIIDHVLQLHHLCVQAEAAGELTNEFLKKTQELDASFEQYALFMFKLVKKLAERGKFTELYLRLDFNRYFEQGNPGSRF